MPPPLRATPLSTGSGLPLKLTPGPVPSSGGQHAPYPLSVVRDELARRKANQDARIKESQECLREQNAELNEQDAVHAQLAARREKREEQERKRKADEAGRQLRLQAEAKEQERAEAKLRADAEAKLRADAEAKVRAEMEEQLRAMEAKLKEEAQARKRAEAEARLRAEEQAERRRTMDQGGDPDISGISEADLEAMLRNYGPGAAGARGLFFKFGRPSGDLILGQHFSPPPFFPPFPFRARRCKCLRPCDDSERRVPGGDRSLLPAQ